MVTVNSRRVRPSGADHSLHDSNSTAHILLGGARRNWMDGPSSCESAPPTLPGPASPERRQGMRGQVCSNSTLTHLSAAPAVSAQNNNPRPAVVSLATTEAAPRSLITPGQTPLIVSKNPSLLTQPPPADSAPKHTNPAATYPPVASVTWHASHSNAADTGGDGLDAKTTSTPLSASAGPLATAQPPSEDRASSCPSAQPMSKPAVALSAANGPIVSLDSPLLNQATWVQWQKGLEALKSEVERRDQASESRGLETERVHVLLDAVLERDPFFIFLHQIYCLRTANPGLYVQIAELQQPGCLQAMVLLQSLLMDNSNLPPDLVTRFAIFPDSSPNLMHQGWYRQKLQEISRSLYLLASQREDLMVQVQLRKCPPLVDELRQRFEVDSLVFISMIFVDVCRQLYGQRYLPLLNRLFFQDRAIVLQQRSSTGPRNITAEQSVRSHLIREYRKIPLKMNSPPTPETFQCASAGISTQTTPQTVPSADVQSPHAGLPGSVCIQSAAGSPAAFVNTTHAPALTSPHGVPGLPINSSPHLPQAAQTSAASHPLRNAQFHRHPLHQPPMYPAMFTSTASTMPPAWASAPGLSSQEQASWPARHPSLQSNAPPPSGQTAVRSPHTQLLGQQAMPFQLRIPPPAPVQSAKASQLLPTNPLLPSPNYRPPINANPNPLRLALHQSDLREPVKKFIRRVPNGEHVDTNLFQYMSGFILPPTFWDPEKSSHVWTFLLSSVDSQRFPRTIDQGAGKRPLQIFQADCRTLRLRSIRLPPSKKEEARRIWATAPTAWPSAFYIFVNGEEMFVRRKLHNGRDLPLDITSHLREGENRITIHMLLDPSECKDLQYIFGVEVMDVTEVAQLKRMVLVVSAGDSRASIQRRLSPATNNDEVAIVTDSLTVSLLDPFSALIFKTPARSRFCDHQECFDLDNFLMTRKSVSGTAPMNDNWQCPICKVDARPQCLIVDSFLAFIRQELERTGRLDGAQAIQFKCDGSWDLKVFNNDESHDSTGNNYVLNTTSLNRNADRAAHLDSGPNQQSSHRKDEGSPGHSGPTPDPIVIELD